MTSAAGTGPRPAVTGPRRAAVGCGAAAVALLAGVAALGDSAAVPGLGGATPLPPWDVAAHPSSALVTALLAVAWTLAAAAVGLGLLALRAAGRAVRFDARRVAPAAVAAALLLAVVPPLGSADHLSYVAYGRIAAAGGDPYLDAPITWRGGTDPVAGAVQPPWQDTPSVYGPVATALQAVVAVVGGGSLRGTVWAWQLLCALAFLATGLALDRLAARLARRTEDRPAARARVAVLWTLNPVLLGQLVLGAHVDVVAAAFAAGALALAVRSPLVAGALLGAAAATKAPFALAGLALLWGVRRLGRARARRAVGLGAVGASAVLVPAHLWSGPHTYDQLRQAARFVSFATPWRLLVDLLDPVFGRPAVRGVVGPVAIVLAVGLAVLLARRVAALAPVDQPVDQPAGQPGDPGRAMTADAVRLFAAVALGWVLTVPYALPWYDALAWLPLAVLAPSLLDGALLARLGVLALGYVPGRVVGMSPQVEALTVGFRRQVAPWLTLAVLVTVAGWAASSWAGRRTPPSAAPRRAPAP